MKTKSKGRRLAPRLAAMVAANLLGILTLTQCLSGCSQEAAKDGEATQEELALSLKAPSGEMIADDIRALKEEASLIINGDSKAGVELEIVALNYFPASTGYAVIVEYLTSDGNTGNFMKSKGVGVNCSGSELVMQKLPRLKSSDETSGNSGVTFSCIANGSCSTCGVEGTYNPQTNVATVMCSCNECILKSTTR